MDKDAGVGADEEVRVPEWVSATHDCFLWSDGDDRRWLCRRCGWFWVEGEPSLDRLAEPCRGKP